MGERNKSWHLSNWNMGELRYELAYQQAPERDPGLQCSSGPGQCGHHARGSGYCAKCLQREIDRREKSDG